MEFCSICQQSFKSLRKHYDKSPDCKELWEESNDHNAGNLMDDNDSFSDPSVVHSDDEVTVYSTTESLSTEDEALHDDDECEQKAANAKRPLLSEISPEENLGFTINQYCETELLKILNDNHVPHGVYKEVLEWAHRAKRMKYAFQPTRTKRSTQLQHLTSWQAKENRQPFQKNVALPGDPMLSVNVTCYDFKTELLSLLTSSVFSDVANLDVFPTDPYGKYKSSTKRLNCFNAGKWYANSHKKLCLSENDFFVPIFWAFDESTLRHNSFHISPLKFTTSLLNQKARNKEENWRTLCFIPDLAAYESSAEHKKQSPTMKSQRLHSLFRAGMESYLACEQDKSLLNDINLSIVGISKKVNVRIACALVLGDIQGGDKICCRAPCYSNTLKRLCRKCTIPGPECTNLDFKCHKVSMRRIKRLVEKNDVNRLAKYHQYCVDSIWYDFHYGGCKFGIFTAATPTEWLHALDNGLIEHALVELNLNRLDVDKRISMDTIVKGFVTWPRQRFMTSNSNSSFPRLLWKNGISTLSDITADYKYGMLFTVVIVSLTAQGKKLFEEAFKCVDKAKGMQTAFQRLLAYRSWLRKSEYWEVDDPDGPVKAKQSIKKCLQSLIDDFPRTKGQGWNVPKFHEQLHVPDDITRNGPPSVTYSGVVEHQHVTAKKHAQRTRKHLATMDNEIGRRMHETIVINETYAMMKSTIEKSNEWHLATNETVKNTSARRVHLFCRCQLQPNQSVVYEPNHDNILKDDHNNALKFLLGEWNLSPGDSFYLLSEIRFNQTIYRAHKSFWSADYSEWHDWVMLRFSAVDDQSHHQKQSCTAWFGDSEEVRQCHEYAPGRIIALVSKIEPKKISNVEEEVFAILETCTFPHRRSSLFTTEWNSAVMWVKGKGSRDKKVKRLELHQPSSFVGHCLMIPQDDTNEVYHQVWSPELWADVHHKD